MELKPNLARSDHHRHASFMEAVQVDPDIQNEVTVDLDQRPLSSSDEDDPYIGLSPKSRKRAHMKRDQDIEEVIA